LPPSDAITKPRKSDRHNLLCLYHILDGLRQGLCKFSGPSRVAIVYAIHPEDPLRIFDPQGLLKDHKKRMKEYFIDTDEWRRNLREHGQLLFDKPQSQYLDLPDVLSLGSRARGTAYQMWFSENHVDLCSPGPIYRWMEFALLQLSQSFLAQDILSAESAGHLLQEMEVHAVHDHIVEECTHIIGSSPKFHVYHLLESVIQISKTPEEGAWARGRLAFVEPCYLPQVQFLTTLPKTERPLLENYKHVRKLLQAVERSSRTLISDGKFIIGISINDLPQPSLCCEFRGRHGLLSLNRDPICSFSDGAFHGTNRKPTLAMLEAALKQWPLDFQHRKNLFSCITRIVATAGEEKYGCTVVVDPSNPPLHLSGQALEEPICLEPEENLRLAAALAKVDGALHVDSNLQLRSFACLMDGPSLPTEDRARGARYNSALSFTTKHPGLIVVVVSSDRPVSVIQNGTDLSQPHTWPPISNTLRIPPTLAQWLT
jgi:hypothetical protein